jgi:2-deoxy-D-gluconate 3-dehydrogenase
MLKEYKLDGKVALVTGSGRGLGREIAFALAEAGADVIVTSRTKRELEQTAAGVRERSRRCLAVPVDVSRMDQITKLVEESLSHFKKIDILVNNAGSGVFKALIPTPGLEKLPIARILPDISKPLTDEEWNVTWDTNVRGVYNCIKTIVPGMIAGGKGKIINVVSTAATRYTPFQSIYPATKAALVAITRTLAMELARFNINVNAIGPGMFETVMLGKLLGDEDIRGRLVRTIPLRRFGRPREVGLLAVYLAAEASDYVTGQTLYIDGGYTVA